MWTHKTSSNFTQTKKKRGRLFKKPKQNQKVKSSVSCGNPNHIKTCNRELKKKNPNNKNCDWHKLLSNGARLNAEIRKPLLISTSYPAEDHE